jgi:hypothetical protein
MSHRARASALLVTLAFVLVPTTVRAVGEAEGGYPSWPERVLHEWTNRARVDPAADLVGCGNRCSEPSGCYQALPPLAYVRELNLAARFHATQMRLQGYMAHTSRCILVDTQPFPYPLTCDGAVACACKPNTTTCDSSASCTSNCCTRFDQRVARFGAGASGEIIAGGADPESSFYAWLYENYTGGQCAYAGGAGTNGHRWNILKSQGSIGYGVDSGAVGDFGFGGAPAKIPSGSHYPRQASAVEVWTNWYDAAGPSLATVDVDGTCTPLQRKRGSEKNGAWSATLSNVGSGCHRYYFVFKDQAGAQVTYPTTGSLGIGDETCADWDPTRPALGAGCSCTPSCAGKTCGDDGCGGSCGACAVPDAGSVGGDGGGPSPPLDAGGLDAAIPSGAEAPSGCQLGGRDAHGVGLVLLLTSLGAGLRRRRRQSSAVG